MTIEEVNAVFKQKSVDDWCDWLDDLLRYDIAYPSISAEFDQISEIIDWFKKFEISNKAYQLAVLEKLEECLLDTNSDQSENIQRLIRPLESCGETVETEWLLETFVAEKYSTIIDKLGRHFQTEVLQLLAHGKLSATDQVTVREIIKQRIKNNLSDPVYCAGWLRFVRLQEKDPKRYFQVYKEITAMLLPEQYTQSMKIVLLDLLSEFRYWEDKETFEVYLRDIIEEGKKSDATIYRQFADDAEEKFYKK